LYLVLVGGWTILALGLLSALGGFLYSAGPRPIAYTAASEVAVFLFMGVLIVVIAYAVQSAALSPGVFLAALPIGGPVAAILLANNIRDMESDRRGGRRTLPIVLGRRSGVFVYRALLLEAYVSVGALILFGIVPPTAGLALLSAALVPRLWHGIAATNVPRQLDPVVKKTAGLHALFGVLYCVGVLLGNLL
jgi:1,4-dihydroxy-2-naphthoate octaprenyltransferase